MTNQKDIVDSHTFVEFFKHQHNEKLVLFLDDFEALFKLPLLLRFFLEALRAVKQLGTDQCGLHSIVALGLYKCWTNLPYMLSPFDQHWDIPYFTLKETQNLFTQYTKASGAELEAGTVEHVFDITKGHPGLVCLCGKVIKEKLVTKSKKLSLAKWKTYAQFELHVYVPFFQENQKKPRQII